MNQNRRNRIWYRQAIFTGKQFIRWHFWGFVRNDSFFKGPVSNERPSVHLQWVWDDDDTLEKTFYEWDICRFEQEEELFIIYFDQNCYVIRAFEPGISLDQQFEHLPWESNVDRLDLENLRYCTVVGNLIEGLKI